MEPFSILQECFQIVLPILLSFLKFLLNTLNLTYYTVCDFSEPSLYIISNITYITLMGVAQGDFLLLAFFDNVTLTEHLCKFSDLINNLQILSNIRA